jgi:type I restriction enzyme R subunit
MSRTGRRSERSGHHLRAGRRSAVLLHAVLEQQPRRLNSIRYRGRQYDFSQGNIQAAFLALEERHIDGLVHTNEKIYDLLVLGNSLQQTILGDTRSFPLHYIACDEARPLGNDRW